MSFADLKKKSSNNLQFLQKELEKTVSNKQVDERFWKPEVDASGNGYAVIRFLPAPDGETVPWAKVYSCLLYTSPSPRDRTRSRMPSSA